jgi:hypothetical protein
MGLNKGHILDPASSSSIADLSDTVRESLPCAPNNILSSAKCHKFGGTHFVILAISLQKEEEKEEEVQTCELQGELTTFAWHFAWQSAHFCFTNDCVKSWLMSQASMQDDTMLK